MSPGRHFLQIPGPTNIPSEVLAALGRETIDHRGPEFVALTRRVMGKLGEVIGTSWPVVIYPSSGTGAWEASLVNTLSPGDRVLVAETGFFSELWGSVAANLGFDVQQIPGDWRHGADPEAISRTLRLDVSGEIKAIAVVHNETSTGVLTRIPHVREAINETGHEALLLVDTISSLGSAEYHHDEWGIDVTIACSQKGLQLPPGIGINALSDRALRAHQTSSTPRSYWDWTPMIRDNANGLFPYTPPTNMLFALDVSLDLLLNEGMEALVERHARHSAATRAAVLAWGLETQSVLPEEQSPTLTAVRVPETVDADDLRRVVLEDSDTSLGGGLGRLKGTLFRIGHLGAFNDAMLLGTIGAVERGLVRIGISNAGDGVAAAMNSLAS